MFSLTKVPGAGGNAVFTAARSAGHAPTPDQASLVSAAAHGFLKSAAAELAPGIAVSMEMTTPLQVRFSQQHLRTPFKHSFPFHLIKIPPRKCTPQCISYITRVVPVTRGHSLMLARICCSSAIVTQLVISRLCKFGPQL